ncbi:MAG: site-specific integrase [Candidatus Eisenbacteria bacterium]|nr:site-specific integrase [Candidatus Eisenbacteria bacterium]
MDEAEHQGAPLLGSVEERDPDSALGGVAGLRAGRSHKGVALPDGTERQVCIYSPHSLRATTATLLFKGGVPLEEVQLLLGHKNPQTTQIYDKRVRRTSESASHKVPF